jgi:hypothetical protein
MGGDVCDGGESFCFGIVLDGADSDTVSKRALCGVNTRNSDYNHQFVVVVEEEEVDDVGGEVGDDAG